MSEGGLLASPEERILTIGGLLLVGGGMLFGDVFAMFVLHPNNARIGEAMYAAAQMIPSGDGEGILAHFAAIGGFLENRGTKVDTHSHMIHVGYIALLLALLQPWVAWSAQARRRLAWFYIICAWLLPPSIFAIHYVGLAYSPLDHIGWASIFADLFGGLLAVAVTLQLFGLWRQFRSSETPASPPFLAGDSAASRTLLIGGLLLLTWGFFYGAGLAAWKELGLGVAEADILKDILTQAAAQAQPQLDAAFGAYGQFQMYSAINVATHTHINELGILLLLLSLLQAFVFYEARTRLRWARAAVISGFALPIGILLEIKFGIIGSIVADLAGFGLIVCLLAMVFGVLRYNGAQDSEGGQMP
jgi:hypothetical protein